MAIDIKAKTLKLISLTLKLNTKKGRIDFDDRKSFNFIKTLMFTDVQVIIADNEDGLERALYELKLIIVMSVWKSLMIESIAFKGLFPKKC